MRTLENIRAEAPEREAAILGILGAFHESRQDAISSCDDQWGDIFMASFRFKYSVGVARCIEFENGSIAAVVHGLDAGEFSCIFLNSVPPPTIAEIENVINRDRESAELWQIQPDLQYS